MNKQFLPKSVTIKNKKCDINSDYRDILGIFEAMNDPDLLDQEKLSVSLDLFYKTDDYKVDVNTAAKEMFDFISMCEPEEDNKVEKPLYSWDQDFNIIVAPINKNLGYDVRGLDYLHWWTFLSAFYEIGECTFNTYVTIRDKLNRGKKLEKYEEKILNKNKDKIILKKHYDSTTQELMDMILGKEG